MSVKPATELVHWPGQDTPACDEHAEKLYGLARVLGFRLTSTLLFDDEILCTNCLNEALNASEQEK